MDWSPDGARIAVGCDSKLAKIWDVASGKELLTVAGHPAGVNDISWSPDGQRIASGDGSGVVKIWDAMTGDEVLSFQVPSTVFNVTWSSDGAYLMVSGVFDVPVIKRVWPSTEALMAHAYECCVTRELTPEERVQFGLPER